MKTKIKNILVGNHYGWIALSYIAICILIISLGVHDTRKMVLDYNKEQAEMVTGLLVEKVNSDINNIVIQLENIADNILLNDNSIQEKKSALERYQESSNFLAVGFIDNSKEFYGSLSDKEDLTRLGFVRQAFDIDNTYITDPYRSSVSGQYIITIFVPVFDNEEKAGIVYANLSLEQIASFAKENSINLPARICMVNSKSLNYIACTDMEDVPAGSWYSLLLKREEMVFDKSSSYRDFLYNINNDISDGILCFSLNGRDFTVGYSSIEKMPNWYIALELGNDELSDTFTKFSSSMTIYMLILFGVTFLYAICLIAKELIQRKRFQNLSSLDTMTGIYNKRTFISLVEQYMQSKNGKNVGSLIFVDVDDFKKYNDKYGHLNGDIVLKKFAKGLSEQFSSGGYVGRYGGDEFVVFLKDSFEKELINEKMAALRKSLENIELEGFGNVPASFSAGGAVYPVDAISYEELCNVADKALYQVKESGKGKFYWYQ